MQDAYRAVEQCDFPYFRWRHREDRANKKLLHVLGALRRAVEHQNAYRGRHGIDDTDHRFLLQQFFVRPSQRKKHGAADRKRKAIPVTRLAVDRITGKHREGKAERRDLRERQVGEYDATRQHMHAEIGVDSSEHKPGNERPQQQLDHSRVSLGLQGCGKPFHVLIEQRDIIECRSR